MSSQNLCRKWIGRGWLAGAVAVGLLAFGCTPDYVTGNTAPVNLYIAVVTNADGGLVLDSDIRSGSGSSATVLPDFAVVKAAVRYKNPLQTTVSVPDHVLIDSYTVRYFRTDGRGVEGVDVPYRITGSISTEIDVATTGTSDIEIEVVRRQAKNEPPLSTIQQNVVLTAFAELTIYGQTVAGERVSATGRLQIDFADYADATATARASTPTR
jgi:hypothetical protein